MIQSSLQVGNVSLIQLHEGLADSDYEETACFRHIIEMQQGLIGELRQEVGYLKSINSWRQNQLSRLKQKLLDDSKIHQLQIEAKQLLIDKLNSQLNCNRQQQPSQSQKKPTNQQQLLKQQHIYTQNQLKTYKNKLTLLEQLIQSYQQNEHQLHQSLIAKQVQIQKLQHNQQQLNNKIIQLQQIIEDLKCSYIHAELQRNQLQQKYKKEQKSLKVSRLTNNSININQTQVVKCNEFTNTTIQTSTKSLNNSFATKHNKHNPHNKLKKNKQNNSNKSNTHTIIPKTHPNNLKPNRIKPHQNITIKHIFI